MFASGAVDRYEFERDPGDCACEAVEAMGIPVSAVGAEDGDVLLTLHVEGADRLRKLFVSLRDAFGGVSLRRLLVDAGDDADPAVVDRKRFTDSQREVFETAVERGFFDSPREITKEELAAELDIAPSTLSEHLAAAGATVLDDLFGVE